MPQLTRVEQQPLTRRRDVVGPQAPDRIVAGAAADEEHLPPVATDGELSWQT
jgi:hypothetical protein